MKTTDYFRWLLIYTILLAVIIFPFLPGDHDPLSIPLSASVQLYSGLGLLTCIPTALWLYQAAKRSKAKNDVAPGKHNYYIKFCAWTGFVVLFAVILISGFGYSGILGILLFVSLIIFMRYILKKVSQLKPGELNSVCTPLGLMVLPVLLLVFQLLIDKPLTDWSRARAINNSNELIGAIESYKSKYDKYPPTLNAIWKDYDTGVVGIEKYHYTYDDSAYNLYFEQPRFLFERIGTREFEVYHPKDNHLMLSHTAWHLDISPHLLRQNQGWYESHEAGIPHWKYFWFD